MNDRSICENEQLRVDLVYTLPCVLSELCARHLANEIVQKMSFAQLCCLTSDAKAGWPGDVAYRHRYLD